MWYLKNYDELTKEEIVAIYKARIETFIVGQDLNYQEIDDKDKKSWHLFEMNDAGEVISYLRIIPEKDKVRLGRVLINKRYQGQGKGRALLERAKEVCKEWFVDKIIEWSKQKNELKVVDDQVSSPTYSKDLAYFSWEIIKKGLKSGIYHFTNDGIASKYDQAQYILEKISWKGNLVRAKSEEFNLLAERPKFSKLSCKKIKEKLGVSIPSWKDAIDRYFKENNK